MRLLADGMASFEEHCARGIEPDRERIADARARLADAGDGARTRTSATTRAAKIAKKAHHERTGLREAALALGYVSAEQYDQWVRPEDMVGSQPR